MPEVKLTQNLDIMNSATVRETAVNLLLQNVTCKV